MARYTSENRVTLDFDLRLPDGTRLSDQRSLSNHDDFEVTQYFERIVDDRSGRVHFNDPGARLMDWLTGLVFTQCQRNQGVYRGVARRTRGTVNLLDGQGGPCRTCRRVYAAFQAEFPHVVVTVRYPAHDRQPVTRGKAGGAYGYDDAVLDNGVWTYTLPAE